ncbi:hypothetical protein ABFS82_14G249100 [Erythranthe guttata]
MATFFIFSCLVLSICILSVSAANNTFYLNIDCGSSKSYEDEKSIVWTGDDNYIKTGEPHSVQSAKYSVSHVMDTMRVFTTRKKNCYHIDDSSVKQGQRVLVRASFLYGNYDNKSSPPKFDLFIEDTEWEAVETSMFEVVYYEVIYVLDKDSISVCVSRSSLGIPFISALEVRGLTFSMYPYQYLNDGKNYPLFLRRRVAFGSNQTIRYPTDPYDRIWTIDNNYTSFIPLSNEATFSNNGVRLGQEPPLAVLKHAVTVAPRNYIVFPVGIYFPVKQLAYYTAYFSEVTQLRPTQKRSFRIHHDNNPYSQPIVPPYGDYIERYSDYITFSKDSNLFITADDDSTLPPLINALEIFAVGKPLINGTDDRDVQGLASLQKAFPVLQEWTGDPCLPRINNAWEWVGCNDYNYKPRPRVTHLDLSNNSLKGPIPDFITRLPNLMILDVSYNQLNGSILAPFATKSGLGLRVAGNPDLCVEGKYTSCRPAYSCGRKMNINVMTILFGSIIPIIITSYTLF